MHPAKENLITVNCNLCSHRSMCLQHTPRVNGEIPDVNDATLDHERLAERLFP